VIKFADDTMLSDLKAIWQECFGDSREYIDMYFSGRFKKGKCLVYIADDVVCAMLVIYDAGVMLGGEYKKLGYIYGVCTRPEYRGRGISGKLLAYARDYISKNGGFSVLAPATESLVEFYKKRGFSEAFYVRQAGWETERSTVEAELLPVSAEEYKMLRDDSFARDGYVLWGSEMIEYALSENGFSGGKSYKVSAGGKEYILLYYISDGTLYVQETTLGDDVLKAVLDGVAEHEGCNRVSARLHTGSQIDSQERVIAMADRKIDCRGYMNIVFD